MTDALFIQFDEKKRGHCIQVKRGGRFLSGQRNRTAGTKIWVKGLNFSQLAFMASLNSTH
ncbi:hypothetical protein BJP44_09565 [Candidatus Williamhamiltonella defendens]|uniref:Transposase n=1 Tax=Candidatus Williamhamiltonella defendens TaxID=138072 RepID=A0A2D3TEH6_9ENTR|nr:hypothetical protein BJP44_09565 [Candidatus Hamiltonella defensa]ATW32467.1 hypothetical protein BJP42_09420 [Candidatus Hamiltonella defensa]ATW34220.1 hypothetical protein BJP43_08090 [Candidatus Hamiltonella defensa]